ncbi:hypothetical protein E4U13_000432 [Claviceps humidiphila]|uniref:Uncharacterized protein n=1 Tax=Claviceps humidiphila TaxID=1294629 RepID=A0A9P7TX56_9HYPO|nr:hypothetical protein E4U13_000432 [Claviceps humidiphila]
MHSELLKNMRGGRNPDSSLSRGPEVTGRQRSVEVCKNLLDEAVHSVFSRTTPEVHRLRLVNGQIPFGVRFR